jgi:lipoprotein signal peptidase
VSILINVYIHFLIWRKKMKKKIAMISLVLASLALGACSHYMDRQLVEEVPRQLDTPCVKTKDGSCAGWHK